MCFIVRRAAPCAGAALLWAAALGAQAPDGARLLVRAPDGATHVLTGAAFRALPHVTVTAAAHGGASHRYTGVPLAVVLAEGGAWPAARSVIAHHLQVTAADGYRAVFALAELDTLTVAPAPGGPAVVADQDDGAPLAPADGPFRLVVPGDRRPARAVRQVTLLEVRAAAPVPGAQKR